MTSKRTKRLRDAQLQEKGRYVRWVEAVLVTVLARLQLLDPPILATSHNGTFSGSPENFSVWFIFATREAHARATKSQTLTLAEQETVAALRASDYPAESLATFKYFATSREEIDDAGGEFAFFH